MTLSLSCSHISFNENKTSTCCSELPQSYDNSWTFFQTHWNLWRRRKSRYLSIKASLQSWEKLLGSHISNYLQLLSNLVSCATSLYSSRLQKWKGDMCHVTFFCFWKIDNFQKVFMKSAFQFDDLALWRATVGFCRGLSPCVFCFIGIHCEKKIIKKKQQTIFAHPNRVVFYTSALGCKPENTTYPVKTMRLLPRRYSPCRVN